MSIRQRTIVIAHALTITVVIMTTIDRALAHPFVPTIIRAAALLAIVSAVSLVVGAALGWTSPWLLAQALASAIGGTGALLALRGWEVDHIARLAMVYSSRDIGIAHATMEALASGNVPHALVGVAKLAARRIPES